jgi:hypothetical protein
MESHAGPAAKQPPAKDKTTVVYIDQRPYSVTAKRLTGAELRRLPDPDIGPEYDLWLEGEGGEEDRKIQDAEEVRLKKGIHFFTAPSHINPGSSC